MSSNLLKLRVVTPAGLAIEQDAASVSLWTTTGEIEVLPGHVPLVTLIEPGELRIRLPRGEVRAFAAGEGFARVGLDSIDVFTDMADDAENIDTGAAQEAEGRARTALSEAGKLTDDERMAADLALREALVKIQISLRRKGGKQHPPA